MPKKKLIIVTDCTDIAANELRATVLRNLERLGKENDVQIEPIVQAENFSIINGTFLVRLMAEIYDPQTTTFLVVLNPLRTNRRERARIIGETKNGFKFVGANTGVFSWLIKDFGIKTILESSRENLDGKKFVSFGGKYIHAPIAAKVLAGIPLQKLGQPLQQTRLAASPLKRGVILHIDNFGVAKIYAPAPKLSEGTRLDVLINGKKAIEAVFTYSMKNLPDYTWAMYPGSSLNNLLELGLVRGNAAKVLSLRVGDIIQARPTK